ncbi:MAG: Porphobilinogen deaminase [Planctomycetota bacterium]|nr:MAG: Porphobilinogen deaminase [Planctomycetota bacterium]
MWQAEHVRDLLKSAAPERAVEIVPLSTIGDRDKTEPLTRLGGGLGVGVFTREIQAALLDGRADIAVHSLKDLPTEQANGLTLAAVPQRGAMFDVLVLPEESEGRKPKAEDREESSPVPSAFCFLPPGSRIGSGSPRRRAQLLHQRPDLQFFEARGNVETRLRKLDEGQFDALVLAEAGLTRLEFARRISAALQPPLMLPAVGQGALGIECRSDDDSTREALSRLIDRPTLHSVLAERTVLSTLRAGCHAPLGVWTRPEGNSLRLTAVVLSLDGVQRVESERTSPVHSDAEAIALGRAVADELLTHGAAALLES